MKRCSVPGGVEALFIAVMFVSGVVHAGAASDVPEALHVPAGEKLSLEAQASGVQIYECRANKDDAKRFEWVFKAPEAQLFDSSGKVVGKHYAGPTWESNDASKVIGEVKAKDAGPDPKSIPWLLLAAKSTSGDGVFGRTRSVQRLHTQGGNAPAEGCDQANVGKEARVPYKAVYRFFVPDNS
jgi:hypothetical protein